MLQQISEQGEHESTLDHSLALCLVLTALLSSAYSAPMNEPIEVPPIMSIGIPASSMAFMTPTWEQPLKTTKRKKKINTQFTAYVFQRHISWAAHLAPPPPSTRAMLFPVRTRASREKSLCLSAVFSNTFSYTSLYLWKWKKQIYIVHPLVLI